jgi:hypothetical protein
MVEKHNVIEPGRTPPAGETHTKTAADLEDHPATRAAQAVADAKADVQATAR